MSKHVMPDTDVLIDFLRGRPEAVTWMEAHQDGIVVSSVSVAELYAGVRMCPSASTTSAAMGYWVLATGLTAVWSPAFRLAKRRFVLSDISGSPVTLSRRRRLTISRRSRGVCSVCLIAVTLLLLLLSNLDFWIEITKVQVVARKPSQLADCVAQFGTVAGSVRALELKNVAQGRVG